MPNTNYVVCKLISWTDFRINWTGGRVEKFDDPPDEQKIIGFMPVYGELEAAVQEGDGFEILPIRVTRRFKTNREKPDNDDDTEES